MLALRCAARQGARSGLSRAERRFLSTHRSQVKPTSLDGGEGQQHDFLLPSTTSLCVPARGLVVLVSVWSAVSSVLASPAGMAAFRLQFIFSLGKTLQVG